MLSYAYFTDEEFLAPISKVIDWLNNDIFVVGEHAFSIIQIITFGILMAVILGFIRFIFWYTD